MPLAVRVACVLALAVVAYGTTLSSGKLSQHWQPDSDTAFPSWVPLSGRDNTAGCASTDNHCPTLDNHVSATDSSKSSDWKSCEKACRTCYSGDSLNTQCTSCNSGDVLVPHIFGSGEEQKMKGVCRPPWFWYLYSTDLENCRMHCEDGAGGRITSYMKMAGVSGGSRYFSYTYNGGVVSNIYCIKAHCKSEAGFWSNRAAVCSDIAGAPHTDCNFKAECESSKMVACMISDSSTCEVAKFTKPTKIINLKATPPTEVSLSLFSEAERTAACFGALTDN